MPESPWGVNPWGVTPWGIGFGFDPELLVAPAFVNSRPYPPDITPVEVVSGGLNSIVLDVDVPDVEGFFTGAYLVYYGPKIVARKIIEYQSGRICVLSHDLPITIPAGSIIFLYSSDDNWIPDLVHVGIRPSPDKRLNITTLEFVQSYGVTSLYGVKPQTMLGNPAGTHDAYFAGVGTDEYVILNSSALGPPLSVWATNDSFVGLLLEIDRNRGAGQKRRIVRYDALTKYAWLDRPLPTVPNTESHYKLSNAPNAVMLPMSPSLTSNEVTVQANYAGLLFEHDGSTAAKNLMCLQAQPFDYYDFQAPLQMYTQFTIHQAIMSAGRAGIGFGFAVPGTTPLGVLCEVMHNGGGGIGDLIFRIKGGGGGLLDLTLELNTDPLIISNKTFACFLVYEPFEDVLRIRVHALFPLPGSVLISSAEIPNFKNSGLFDGAPIPSTLLPPYGFFGAGQLGAVTSVQYLSYSFMNAGQYLIKQGVVQGYRDGEVLSSLPVQTEAGLLPLQWKKPWIPRTRGRREPPPGIQLGVDADTKAVVLAKTDLNSQQHIFARNEPQLEDERTRGFLYTIRFKATVEDNTYDAVGPAVGAVIDKALSGRKEIRLALLNDGGERIIGLLTSTTSDSFLADYLMAYRIDWTEWVTCRIIYEPANGGSDKFFGVFINEETKPRLLLTGAVVDSILPHALLSPLTVPGFYFGMVSHESISSFFLKFARYLFNSICYAAQIFYNTTPLLPDDVSLTYRWSSSISAPGTATYVYDVDDRLIAYNGKVCLDTQDAGVPVFYYRDLNTTALTKEHYFDTTDGMVIEFRMQIEHANNIHSGNTKGIWTGVGVVIDDGVDRILLGFADGGQHGTSMFVTGPDPDTGARLEWDNLQKWFEDVMRRPKYWGDYFIQIDWTQEHLYRFERSAAITSDRNAKIAVYVDDAEDPLITIPFRRGKHMDGADTMEGLPGATPRVAWGHLSGAYASKSNWREFLYASSVGFDLHLDQEKTDDVRVKEMVSSDNPVMGAMSVNVEES